MNNGNRVEELKLRKSHHATAARDALRADVVTEQNPVVLNEPGGSATIPNEVSQAEIPQQATQSNSPVTAQDVFDWGLEPGDGINLSATENTKSAREVELEKKIAELEASNTELTTAQTRELDDRRIQQEELETLREFKRQRDTEKLLAMDGIEFENLDPEAVKELSNKVLNPVLRRQQEEFDKRTQQMAERLEHMERSRIAEEERLTEKQRNDRIAQTNSAIFAAHPDFESIRNSQEFQRVLAQRVKGSSTKLSDIAANEYYAGNHKFIVDLVTKFKSGRPSLEDIASAGTSGTGTTPASQIQDPVYSSEDVTKWNQQVATGELSRETYRKNMANYRAQRSRQSA